MTPSLPVSSAPRPSVKPVKAEFVQQLVKAARASMPADQAAAFEELLTGMKRPVAVDLPPITIDRPARVRKSRSSKAPARKPRQNQLL
jgi:hypothetical protein